MSNTTKKTTNKSSASKSTKSTKTTKTTKSTKTTADKSNEALIKELQAQIEMLNQKLADTNNESNETVAAEPVEVRQYDNFEEPNPNKKTKVYSMVFGLFTIHCPTRGFTEFREYGNFKILSYAQLTDYMLTCDESFKQGRLYISDPQIVEALGLTEYYNEIFSMDFVKDILAGKASVDDIREKIGGSTEKQKQSLATYIAILTYEGKFNDYNVINTLESATGVEINRKIAEMREFAANMQAE